MSYDNNNRLAIWKNDRKEKDSHPDYKGNGTIDGVEYWVKAWAKKGDANPNAPLLSIRVTPKEQQAQPVKQVPAADFDIDDEMPF